MTSYIAGRGSGLYISTKIDPRNGIGTPANNTVETQLQNSIFLCGTDHMQYWFVDETTPYRWLAHTTDGLPSVCSLFRWHIYPLYDLHCDQKIKSFRYLI